MKKHSKIIAIGLSCAMAFSLAACGDDTPNSSPAPNPDGVKTEQVTETQWKAAFDFSDSSNLTVYCNMKQSAMGITNEMYQLAKFDGNKIYHEYNGYEDDEPEEGIPQKTTLKYYYSVEGADTYFYYYDKTDKKWVKEYFTDADNVTPDVFFYDALDVSPATVANSYSRFTYSEKKNAYVATDVDDIWADSYLTGVKSISVKITNGKLSVFQMDMEVDHDDIVMTGSITYQAYDYGTTSVTLPNVGGVSIGGGEIIGGDNGKVTETQWNAAFEADMFENVTVVLRDSAMPGREMIMKNDVANRIVYQSSYRQTDDNPPELYETIVAYKDGQYRELVCIDEGEWQYVGLSSDTAEDIANNVPANIAMFKNLYSQLTYNDETKQYTAENISLPNMDVPIDLSIKFSSGKLQFIELSAEMLGVRVTNKMIFSDYGTTYINIPDVDMTETPSGGVADEKDWLAAFEESQFYNCEFIMDDGRESYSRVQLDYKNKRMRIENNDGKYNNVQIIYDDNGKLYQLEQADGGTWERSELGGDIDSYFDSYFSMFAAFKPYYGLFKLKGENVYIAYNQEISSTLFDSVIITFDGLRVAEIEGNLTYDEVSMMQRIRVQSYGNVVIDLPDVQ